MSSKLVHKILSAAKLRCEKKWPESVEIDLVDTLKKMFTINTEDLLKNQVSVKAMISSDIPPIVRAEPCGLQQILMNLTLNAIKFSQKNQEIKIYMKWYAIKADMLALKQPTKINPFDTSEQDSIIY